MSITPLYYKYIKKKLVNSITSLISRGYLAINRQSAANFGYLGDFLFKLGNCLLGKSQLLL